MVTDQQILRLRQALNQGMSLSSAAAKAGMDRKTAGKYRQLDRLPSEVSVEHTWRTREDPFDFVWPWVEEQLAVNPGLQAKTLFHDLQRQHPGRFPDGQLRTLQRRVKQWRAQRGPAKEVFFAQVHHPGRLAASDFTHCSELAVTINGVPFPHLIYHFVLTYSNWEAGTVCFSESFESLSEGLQNALWELGGVPLLHRTDRLTACVQPGLQGKEAFKRRYQALLGHYGLTGQAIQAGKGNENGDVEQRHHRFKDALDQALMLRGSRDFNGRDGYAAFLRQLYSQLNAGRQARLAEEMHLLRPLPSRRLDACKRLRVRVEAGSTVRVEGNVYSLPSRLIGEWVEARLYAERVEVWYSQKRVEELPRLRGRNKHEIDYRHVIDWLVRKPGAFADYRYRADMFPSSRFRMAYDLLVQQQPERAAKEYLRILHAAALQGEAVVEAALLFLLDAGGNLNAESVQERLRQQEPIRPVTDVTVPAVDLATYDALLDGKEACDGEEQGR
jgi:Mu transposase-like protein